MFLLSALGVSTVRADEVILTNGDRLTGTVIAKTPEGLQLRTDYAGTVRIDWRMVDTLRTDEPVSVLMRQDGGMLDSRLERSDEPGTVRLEAAPEVPPVRLERIAYLNPTPSQSGMGTEYQGRVNLGGSASSGNSDARQLSAEGELSGVARDSRFTARLRGERRTEGGNETASNWLANADHDWFVSPKRFVYARGSAERDRFRDLSYRLTAGSGYGVQLIDDDRTGLSLRGGLDYVREHRFEADGQSYPAFGWGLRFRHWLMGRTAEFFHEQEGYVKMDDARDATVRLRTGLRVPIVDQLSAQVQGIVDWEGRPAEGREATDVTVQFGLGYEW
ncbi:DUF481 domain-containing protein [Pseudothauera nasutitermitis]|uniref:DUF481 domain-containing protein n=1 Tax=Pseudothauera nasutitermitis TaxID=2565930 RepID=UPI001454BEE6|nr:DUF481 domain-containing protein [Pseudothauera nasutitermitis]